MLCLLLAAALQFTPADAQVAHETARGLVENHTPRDSGTVPGALAAQYLIDRITAVGGEVKRDRFRARTPDGDTDFANIYADFISNPTGKWVIVVSHYDTKTGVNCPGANDGASTSGLLVALAGVRKRQADFKGDNLLLIWTDGEECMESYSDTDGLWGSKRAADYVVSTDRKVKAVICLDMLGDRDLAIKIPANGSEKLARIAEHAARRSGHAGLVSRVDDHVKDDHVPFVAKGFNAIDLIDFSYGPNNSYWHTEGDTMEHISEGSLLKSGQVVTELLNILL